MPATFSSSEKSVVGKKRVQSRAKNQPKFTAHGRPGKRTPQLEKDLLAAISTGAQYRIACQAVGISEDSFIEWRRKDPVFAAQVEKAAGKTALRLLKKIEANAEENFSAAAWILERRFPTSFSRPEVQLNLIQQNNINTQGSNGGGFESLVISDLEFLGLRQKEGYEHRPHEAREVPGEITVEPALSGTLTVQGHPGAAVISETQAEATQRRVREADSKIDALLKAKRAGNGNGAPGTPEPASAAMKLSTITIPSDPVPSHWWAQLTTGTGDREVERGTAIKICRAILSDVFGELRSQNTPVEFAPGAPILLRDVHAGLECLCGARGWAALTKRAEGSHQSG